VRPSPKVANRGRERSDGLPCSRPDVPRRGQGKPGAHGGRGRPVEFAVLPRARAWV